MLSADGLNWSGPRTAPWLIVPAGTVLGNLGDGHTGYARMAPNIFSRSAIPYNWIIASLFGGGDICLYAQWGCNDPTRGRATFIQTISSQHGRPGMEAGLYCSDVATAGPVRQGIAGLGGGLTQSGSGPAVQRGSLFEFLFDPTGTEIIAKPIPVIGMPLNADVTDNAAIPTVIARETERIVMAQGVNVPTDGTAKRNVTFIGTSSRRNRQNT